MRAGDFPLDNLLKATYLFTHSRVLTLAMVLASSGLLGGQTATVSGTVSDPSGSPIAGAKIDLIGVAEGSEREAFSSDGGVYAVPDLRPGRYDISITRDHFSSTSFHGVEVTVGQSLTLNATLEIGRLKEGVNVEGAINAPIDFETAQISNVVDSRRILDLPLLTRDPYSLVRLSPGVVPTNSALGGFAVNGSRERNNNFLLDGADNNDTSVPGGAGGLVGLDPESTEEFRVITNNYMPEFGRNTGAIIDIVTRRGTNAFHGNAYWFGRYNALAARDYFNAKPDPQAPFVRNDFGWSFGGPVRKDQTFFFVNNEYQRFRTTLTNTSVVPTAAFKSGVFAFNGFVVNLRDRNSPNNILHLPLDATMQKALALLPNPNGEQVDQIRGIYRFPSASKLDTATTTFRLDHQFTAGESIYLRYAYNGSSDPDPLHDEIAPGLGATGTAAQTHSLAANFLSALRPNVVNQFRAGINRVTDNFDCGNYQRFDQLGALDMFGRGSDYSISGLPIIGCGALTDSNGQMRRTGTWGLSDGLSYIHGSHNAQFGGEFRYVFENGYDAYNSRTQYNFNVFTDFRVPVVNIDPAHPCNPRTQQNCGSVQLQNQAAGLLGFVAEQLQSQFFDHAGARNAVDYRRFVQHEYAVYAQDSWHARPNLTLNYGMRYQFNGVPFERSGNLSNLYGNPAGFAPFTFTVNSGSARTFYNNDAMNFEPRIGFNWDPFGNGRTAIRGGYGIFHDRVFGNLFENAGVNPPFVQNVQNLPLDILPNVTTPAGAVPTAIANDGDYLRPSIFSANLRNPVSQNWNAGVQRELPAGFLLDLNYVASKGSREFRVVNGNPPSPARVNGLLAAGVPPANLQGTALYISYPATNNTAFLQPAFVESIGNSSYHSLQANLTRRFTHGMMLQAAWTWSHSIDDASDPLRAGEGNRSFPRNSLNLAEERGNSDFDERQRLVLNYLFELPFGRGRTLLRSGVTGRVLEGWQIAGISEFSDGLPYDLFAIRDSEHTSFAARANLIGNAAIPSGADRTRTGPPVSAFADPPFGRPGNLGRNTFTGPGTINTDMVLSKRQSLGERANMQLRFEFYNLFNRVQLLQPGNSLASPGTFGISTGTVTRPDGTSSNRQIQLALKLVF